MASWTAQRRRGEHGRLARVGSREGEERGGGGGWAPRRRGPATDVVGPLQAWHRRRRERGIEEEEDVRKRRLVRPDRAEAEVPM